MSGYYLGRLPAIHDPRTLRLEQYASASVPPREVHRSHITRWPMFANDRAGDCTVAAALHCAELWHAETRTAIPNFTDQQALATYSAITGYDPATGANDNGAVELDVLNYWRNEGIAGDKLGAFVAVNWKRADEVRRSVWEFGACYLGVSLPLSAQAQIGGIWDVPAGGLTGPGQPGSWGGHAIPVVSYDSQRLAVVTWGTTQLMTWRFLGAYCEEAYALLSADMLAGGRSPQGFDITRLQADLQTI